jgi:hypothetical protein
MLPKVISIWEMPPTSSWAIPPFKNCSFVYGQWDSLDAVGAAYITISNSILAFPIGQQFGVHAGTGPSTFYCSLWVSAHNRQPSTVSDNKSIK